MRDISSKHTVDGILIDKDDAFKASKKIASVLYSIFSTLSSYMSLS